MHLFDLSNARINLYCIIMEIHRTVRTTNQAKDPSRILAMARVVLIWRLALSSLLPAFGRLGLETLVLILRVCIRVSAANPNVLKHLRDLRRQVYASRFTRNLEGRTHARRPVLSLRIALSFTEQAHQQVGYSLFAHSRTLDL